LSDLYNQNIHLFQNAWQYQNVIATHAGIQNNWFLNEFNGDINSNIAEQLNNPKNEKQKLRLFDIGYARGGNKSSGGIFWADIRELFKPLKCYIQVAGHNRVQNIKHHQKSDGEIYFVDCLGYENEFLKLKIEENDVQRL
jgi:hypothetical protein